MKEDRRAGHAVSLVLGLLTIGGRRDEVTLHLMRALIGEATRRRLAPGN